MKDERAKMKDESSHLIAQSSSLIAQSSHLIAHISKLIAHRSKLTSHRSSLIAHISHLRVQRYTFSLRMLLMQEIFCIPLQTPTFNFQFSILNCQLLSPVRHDRLHIGAAQCGVLLLVECPLQQGEHPGLRGHDNLFLCIRR